MFKWRVNMCKATEFFEDNIILYIKNFSTDNNIILNLIKNENKQLNNKIYVITQVCSSVDYDYLLKKNITVFNIKNWWGEKELKNLLSKFSKAYIYTFQINDFLRLLKLKSVDSRVLFYVNNVQDVKLVKEINKNHINYTLLKMFIAKAFKANAIYLNSKNKKELEEYFLLDIPDTCINQDIYNQEVFENIDNQVVESNALRLLYFYRKSMHYIQRVGFHLKSPYGSVSNFVFFPLYKILKKIFKGRNERKIKSMKGKFKGKKIFVVATGPSLCEKDVRLLKDEYTIGVNISWKLFKKAGYRPTFFMITDPEVFKRESQNPEFVLDSLSDEMNFFNSLNRKMIHGEKSVYLKTCFLDHMYNYGSNKYLKICDEIDTGYYDLYSVTEDAINLALYLGFSEIILIGADNNYLGKKQYFDETYVPYLTDYFYSKKCQEINNETYRYIYEESLKRGVEIKNATRGGYVEAFERIELEDAI